MRRGVASVLSTLFLVSGCLAGSDTPNDGKVGDVPVLKLADLPWVLNIGPGADAESSIDVSPDGQTILVCSHGGFTHASAGSMASTSVARSTHAREGYRRT